MRNLAWLALLALSACGGSSSETPPPLEPDPTSYRYTGPDVSTPEPRQPQAAVEAEPEMDEDDLPARSRSAAPSTWGTDKPTRHRAPAPKPSASVTAPANAP